MFYNNTYCIVKPVFSDHIKQDICLAFQTGGCLLLYGGSAESFLRYFHSAISNHLLTAISMSPEWMVAVNRFNCTVLFLCQFSGCLYNKNLSPEHQQ